MAQNRPDTEYILVIKPSGVRLKVLATARKVIEKANAFYPAEKRDRIYPYTKGAEFLKGMPEEDTSGITKTIDTIVYKHSQEMDVKDKEIQKLRKQLKAQAKAASKAAETKQEASA